MSGRNAFNPDTDDRPTYPVVKAEFGEDPARYLALDDLYLAYARIRGIATVELLKEWQRIESNHWGRSEVMKRLNAREAELTDEPTPEPTDSRATATDGGTVETPDDNAIPTTDLTTTAESDATSSSSDSASDPDDVHPDVRGLEVGQVLELERADGTEYIFPAQPAADEPFLCRSFDEEGDERTAEPIPLSLGEVASRPINDTDPKPVSEIDRRAPTLAASNGGSQ